MPLVLAGCQLETSDIPAGECSVVVWAQPDRERESLSVRGSWDNWQGERSMRRFDDTWNVATFSLAPGEYGYQIVEDGEGRLDSTHGLTRFRRSDGQEVSYLRVHRCDAPRIESASVSPNGPDGLLLTLQTEEARTRSAIDPSAVSVVGHTSTAAFNEDGLQVFVEGLEPGKHALEVELVDEDGSSQVQTVDAWVQPRAERPEDQIIYQVMIDRFHGDEGAALDPPPNAGARAGGTLGGITAKLRDGTFDRLPITTLWLSPVYVNPDEARAGTDGQMYEGYHGYWPVDSRGVDERIGGEEAFRELLDEAHARGIRVLLDIVPNHVYETNPRYEEYLAIGGVHQHEQECVCGQPGCPWDQFIQTCWFVPYLPDLDFTAPDMLDLAVQDALWWQETFDLDGFRVDAVPMMPRTVTRRIAAGVRQQVLDPQATFALGEIFTGPGTAGTEVLRYYLGPDALDSAFDFPLMWSLRTAIAHGGPGFDAVEAGLQHTEEATDGADATLGLMIGNHDVTRFMSEVVGDAGVDPWGEVVPVQPEDAGPYQRQAIALGLVLTLPGAPVIYYGDEVGLAGASDPDCRRVMPADDELVPGQVELRDVARTLAQARLCFPALRRGERVLLHASSNSWAFMRDAGDDGPVLVVAHRGGDTETLALGEDVYPGAWRDLISGETLVIDAQTELELLPWSLRVLVPAAHVCAQ
jgi:glycosidase